MSASRISGVLAGLVLLLTGPLVADPSTLGPAVGTAIPAIETVDQDGTAQRLATLRGERGAVLVFFRSADWCPFCQRQLIDLKSISAEATALGYPLVGVSYDTPAKLRKFARQRKIDYTLLSDESSAIIDAFGIRNTEYGSGHYAEGVPHPVIFVVDQNGRVLEKFSREGYKERPEPEVVIGALRTLAAGR